jgi:hypothetical protein
MQEVLSRPPRAHYLQLASDKYHNGDVEGSQLILKRLTSSVTQAKNTSYPGEYHLIDLLTIKLKYKCTVSQDVLFSKNQLNSGNVLLLRLVISDQNCNHCVSVCQGWIFDSSFDTPLMFTHEHFDLWCSTEDSICTFAYADHIIYIKKNKSNQH